MLEVYKVTCCTNGKVYIGITSRGIEQRWSEHVADAFNANNPDYGTIFKKAIRKYGADAFSVEKIDEASSFDELKEKEQKYIKLYNSFAFDENSNGYNSTRGGDGMLGFGLKPVVQIQVYPLKILNIYDGVTYAEKIHGRGVLEVCNKNIYYAGGYTWMYKEEADGLSAPEFMDRVYGHLNVVVQIDLDGNVVRYWKGSREAAETCGYNQGNISYCCLGKRKFSDGFQWMFYRDYVKCRDKDLTSEHNVIKSVCQYNINGDLIRKFQNTREAYLKTGIAKVRISEACNRCYSTLNGYIWRYEDHVLTLQEIKHVQREVELGLRTCTAKISADTSESFELVRPAASNSRECTKDRGFIQYSLEGEKIARFKTLGDASFETSTSFRKIIDVCKGKRNKSNDFVWRFADEPLTEEECKDLKKFNSEKRAVRAKKEANREMLSKRNGLKFSRQCFRNRETGVVYFSQKEVCDLFHCAPKSLQKACEHQEKTCAGYHWEYAHKEDAIDREQKMLTQEEDETDDWYKYYFALVSYIQTHGAFPTSNISDESLPNLYVWMKNIRRHYASRAKCLSETKINKLKDINFPFTPQDDEWNRMFAVYQDYVANTGSGYVSRRSIYNNEKLGQWVYLQKKLDAKGSLKAERKRAVLQVDPTFFSKRDNHGRIIATNIQEAK